MICKKFRNYSSHPMTERKYAYTQEEIVRELNNYYSTLKTIKLNI
jgi:dsRNA-specific ribonuclease